MRLEWLEDILAVAETGSFSEAAERRHLTQSAFSRRIRSIEDHVGAPLFDRSRKPVRLSPATQDLRPRIAELAGALSQLGRDLRRGAALSGNKVVLASQHALTTALTPALIGAVQSRRPDLFIRLRSANLDACFAQLLGREADLALVYRVPGEAHPIAAEFIESLTLGEDRLIPVTAAHAATRTAESLAASELPLIAYPAEVFLGRVTERLILPRLKVPLRVLPKAETALTLAALELAASGLGIAWVPASLARAGLAGGRLADLSDSLPGCPLEVTAVRLAGSEGAAQEALWQHLAGGF